jgi:ABC-type transporter Mla subunit MlaD
LSVKKRDTSIQKSVYLNFLKNDEINEKFKHQFPGIYELFCTVLESHGLKGENNDEIQEFLDNLNYQSLGKLIGDLQQSLVTLTSNNPDLTDEVANFENWIVNL